MTKVAFLTNSQGIYGFKITGHSSNNCEDFEGKLVCSAISSAAYMTANTLSEIIGDDIFADVSDAKMEIYSDNISHEGVNLLKGLKLHITELSLQYPKRIKIISEV